MSVFSVYKGYLFDHNYRKTSCPVPPLNDNNFVKFMRGGTGQGVQILFTFFTKKCVKIFMLCYDD